MNLDTALLHGPSIFAVKAKIYGVLYNQASSIAFDETLVSAKKLLISRFFIGHWSPHGSLVSIGQHFVIMRVVHLPKRTETTLITESDKKSVCATLQSDVETRQIQRKFILFCK